jgi:hypothetical protein
MTVRLQAKQAPRRVKAAIIPARATERISGKASPRRAATGS